MKNYKKTLLAVMIVSAMPLLAATSSSAPIKVTTFADENKDDSLCSLREALAVAKTRVSAHGCVVADIYSNVQNIQLEAGTYTLKKELVPESEVSIWGAAPADWDKESVLVNDVANQYPAQVELKSTIKAENSRIFNTISGRNPLILSNLILTDGVAPNQENGGAIYAGANVTLQSTKVLNSKASTGAGGAIYLAGLSASVTVSKSLFEGNDALTGSIVAMGCFNDAEYSKRNISFTSSSLVRNGSENSLSMLEFCGLPTATLEANTIAKNIANSTKGNLIKFSGDTKAGTENQNKSSILSDSSTLSLTSNTIVENKAYTTFLYDKLGIKYLGFNVLAYNQGDYSCRYLLGDVSKQEKVGINILYNAFSRTSSAKCDLPDAAFKDNTTNIDLTNIPMSTVLSGMIEPSQYTAFLPLYYPKVVSGAGSTDLVNVSTAGTTGCSDYDQRGLARLADRTLFYQPDAKNTCDIGSVELMHLTAGDINSISNTSLSTLINEYKGQYDYFDNLVKNPNDQKYVTYYKYRLGQYKTLVDYFNKKENLKYRAIYVDLKSLELPLPHEVELPDGNHRLDFFNSDLYTIKVDTIGVGILNDAVNQVRDDENLVCSWAPEIQQIVVYRKDDAVTQDGEQALCKYTITYKADPTVKTVGLIKSSFINQAPEAKDTSVTLKYQQKEKVKLNLLELASDAGDTAPGGKGPETKPNKSDFWVNEDGVELPIRLSNVPTKNLVITADRQGKCPVPDQKETCYGGNIYIQEANSFNPFNFSFNYQVYDNDSTPKISNSATVNVISTATTVDDTRPATSGGGSAGVFSIFGLISLLAYRRFRK
ncbi:MAG: CSLREA domain-containing protein [Acinetobacter tjernbergiae]